jgi:hypothetical protein
VFKTRHVKLMLNTSSAPDRLNSVLFYIEPYLNELAEQLHMPPDQLLALAGTHVPKSDTKNFTLIMLLFGDIEKQMYPNFKLDEQIMQAYQRYIDTSNLIVLDQPAQASANRP